MSNFERRIPQEVEAVRLLRPVFDEEGKRLADRGDWLLTDQVEQYYMKDEDFTKEFVRKGPQKEVKVVHTTSVQSYPVYIDRPVPTPCPQPWVMPWWQRGIVWCSSDGYVKSHSTSAAHIS